MKLHHSTDNIMQCSSSQAFVLTECNVIEYLQRRELIQTSTELDFTIKACSSKNFNLVVQADKSHRFLVKQEKGASQNDIQDDFHDEWKIYQLMLNFPELNGLIQSTSQILDYVPEDGIIIAKFFDDYLDADRYYAQTEQYPEEIAASMGNALGDIHQKTHQMSQYRDFLGVSSEARARTPNFQGQFYRLRPEVYSVFSLDAIRFFKIIQQQRALQEALEKMQDQWQPMCLIHRDLKFDNILLHKDLSVLATQETAAMSLLKIVDWECYSWGDPVYDVATVIGNYLHIWLKNLHVSSGLLIQDSLKLANPSLDQLRPSLISFLNHYALVCPKIVKSRPSFWRCVLQFSGYYLLERLVHRLSRHEPFDNQGVCTLQVAKRLVCEPELSCQSILGLVLDDLDHPLTTDSVTANRQRR